MKLVFALLLLFTAALAQTQTGVLRLRVRVKLDDNSPLRGLPRKRFFLVPGTLDSDMI